MSFTRATSFRALILLGCVPLHAQAQDDSAAVRLEPVTVTVARGTNRSLLGSPFALSVTSPDQSRPGQRHTAVDQTLSLIPGLTAVSRNNPSQDPRIAIRGFGSRSAFGVRGIRVLRDGIPLTLPDGQTPLDYMSLESVGSVEVMRGAASAMYGNASGGVIDFRTVYPAAGRVSWHADQFLGSESFSRTVAAADGRRGRMSFAADAAHNRTTGARDHSRARSSIAFARAAYRAGASEIALTLMGLDNPLAENPGALTLEEMHRSARLADPQAVRRDARKIVRQFQAGLTGSGTIAGSRLFATAFAGSRSLDNPLTFAVVEIGRHSNGLSSSIQRPLSILGIEHGFTAGFDAQWQNDLRKNYAVCTDTVRAPAPTASCPDPAADRGVRTLDQRELVSSAGVYLSDDIALSRSFTATLGLRADRVSFEVKDHFVSAGNADDSGERRLESVSPIAGAVLRVGPTTSVYANVATAFETPTATELGNQPDGSAGINAELDPQRSLTVESGIKGFAGASLRYDVALFDTRVTDELVPFEIPGSDGRRYFRNAGRTSRRGAEAALDLSRGPVGLMGSYNFSRFHFRRYAVNGIDYGGKAIPAVPRHRAQAAARLGHRAFFSVIETEAAGRSYVDDANSLSAPGYSVFHARAGIRTRGYPGFTVMAAVQNIGDRVYTSSLAVNAARSRFFEPAPRRTFYFRFSIGRF